MKRLLLIVLTVALAAPLACLAAETKADAVDRMNQAATILNQLIATPDNSIPDTVLKSAKCVAIVPSMIKGGFVFGGRHGRGVATCRAPNGAWSAPAFFTLSGGSWGAQIGVESADVVMMIMNDKGMQDLMSSKFKLGGEASVAAGPVGRQGEASTDYKMKAEVLTYSRTRGLFAGLELNGAVLKADDDSTQAFYGRKEAFRQILSGQVRVPAEAENFVATVRRDLAEARAANQKGR